MISIEQIKELRNLSGAGIADCKKALSINDGNMHNAQLWLQAKGIEKALQNSNNETIHGLIALSIADDQKSACIVEINSETDFLSNGNLFQESCQEIIKKASAIGANINNLESYVMEDLQDIRMRSKENVKIGKVAFLKNNNGIIGSYLHMRTHFDNCGKVAALVSLDVEKITENVKELSKHLAMQIVAQKPLYLNSEDVDQDILNEMQSIYKSEAINANPNKPDNIIEMIIKNKLDKYLEQIVLNEQLFIMDDSKKIKQLLTEVSKLDNQKITIKDYSRLEVGK